MDSKLSAAIADVLEAEEAFTEALEGDQRDDAMSVLFEKLGALRYEVERLSRR